MQTLELKNPGTFAQSVRELWCGVCGYGVVVRREAPACPMCREENWHERARLARYN